MSFVGLQFNFEFKYDLQELIMYKRKKTYIFLSVYFISSLAAISYCVSYGADVFGAWLGVHLGPLVLLLSFGDAISLIFGLTDIMLILSYCVHKNLVTCIISSLGIFGWFVLGAMGCLSSV